MRCSGCDREFSASRWPGLICDSCLANARRHWAMRKRTNAQPTPSLAVTEPARSLAQRQCARCGTVFVASPESTDLCEECEARWQRHRPVRAVRVEISAQDADTRWPTREELAELLSAAQQAERGPPVVTKAPVLSLGPAALPAAANAEPEPPKAA